MISIYEAPHCATFSSLPLLQRPNNRQYLEAGESDPYQHIIFFPQSILVLLSDFYGGENEDGCRLGSAV
jgi:hypothetical protein